MLQKYEFAVISDPFFHATGWQEHSVSASVPLHSVEGGRVAPGLGTENPSQGSRHLPHFAPNKSTQTQEELVHRQA